MFVGREREIAYARSLLEQARPPQLVHFFGSGGIGKTKLLEAIQREFAAGDYLIPDLVDLYDFANQSKEGLLSTLSRHLGVQHFTEFAKQQMQKSPQEDGSQHERNLTKAFVEDYRRRASSTAPIILRFDTLENIRGREFIEWLLRDVLLKLLGSTIIFTAGREPIPDEYLS